MPYSKSKEEAEEIADDAFLKVFKNLNTYDMDLSFKGWFRRILINSAIDYYRRNKKHNKSVDLDHAPEIESFDNNIIDILSVNEIMQVVQGLPPAYKIVFNLYVLEGYKHREIAKQLNISEGTSKSNLSKAIAKLKSKLKAQR